MHIRRLYGLFAAGCLSLLLACNTATAVSAANHSTASATEISPPGAVESAPAAPQIDASRAWQTYDRSVRFSVDDGLSAKIEGERIVLHGEGEFLAEALGSNVSLQTELASVSPRRGALVYMRNSKGCEHIFVLLGDASFIVNNHRANLKAGDEVTVTDHQPAYKELVGKDDIGRRQIHIFNVSSDRVCTSDEFNVLHVAEREPLVYRVVHSSDRADKGLRDRLIKTAAVLTIVTNAHGPYSTGVP